MVSLWLWVRSSKTLVSPLILIQTPSRKPCQRRSFIGALGVAGEGRIVLKKNKYPRTLTRGDQSPYIWNIFRRRDSLFTQNKCYTVTWRSVVTKLKHALAKSIWYRLDFADSVSVYTSTQKNPTGSCSLISKYSDLFPLFGTRFGRCFLNISHISYCLFLSSVSCE